MKKFRFRSTSYIEAESLAEAKTKFADNSEYFAANAEAEEMKPFHGTVEVHKIILQEDVHDFPKGNMFYRFNANNWFVQTPMGVMALDEDFEYLEEHFKKINNYG